jgi:hypothetical protein
MPTNKNDLSAFPEATKLLPNPFRGLSTSDHMFTTPEIRQLVSTRYGADFLIMAVDACTIVLRHKDAPNGDEWAIPNPFPNPMAPVNSSIS